MRGIIIYIFAFIAMMFSLDKAYFIGDVWESQSHPRNNVEVVLNSGNMLTGSLSRDWGNNWLVTTRNNEVHQFSEFKMMKTVLNSDNDQIENSMFYRWRSYLPATLVMTLYFTLLAFLMLRRDSK